MRTNLVMIALFLLASLSVFAQKDMKAPIMAANQKFMDAFSKGATTLNTLYTTDAQLFPPNSDIIKGNTAIGTFWVGAFGSGVKKAKLETLEAQQDGNSIVEVGRYILYGANDAQLDMGKYMVVWKQENGDWKLYRDIFNTSTPPATASK
ncbi:YybH family protein [Spirosoma flavum]|uniref:YybH family protein n=1 Tax=Spirosoma flavum TaxID=2048557 RepID=A0ABW6AEA6_9BACT